MERSYNNRLRLTLFIVVLAPFIIASFVFMRFRINGTYKEIDSRINECANTVINNVNDYYATTLQRVRFVNRYQNINTCLKNRSDVVINGEVITVNNDVEDVINVLFADNDQSEMCIFTTNKNAIPISIIEITDDNELKDLSFDENGMLWAVEGTDSHAYLYLYEKYEFYPDCYNVLRIRVPIKRLFKGFNSSYFDKVYLKLSVGEGESVCVGIEDGKFLAEKDTEKVYCRDYELPDINGTLSVCIDNSIIVREIAKQCIIYFIIVLLLLALAFAVSRTVSENITRELNDILVSIDTNNIDNMKTSKIKSREFKIIQNYLINLTDKIKEENNEKIELQIQMLAQRITPHFIYNNLAAIKRTSTNKFTRAAVDKFVKYCRKIFSNNSRFITVRGEIINSCEYLELMKFCYGFEFDVVTDIDKACENMTLPVNILQPILENAFIHGINCMDEDARGIIKIEVAADSKYLHIKVTDNAGMYACYENNGNYAAENHALDVLRKLIGTYYTDDECGITLTGSDRYTTADVKLEVKFE